MTVVTTSSMRIDMVDLVIIAGIVR